MIRTTSQRSQQMTTTQGHKSEPYRIVGISGSLRSGSYNTGLLRAAQEVAPDGIEITQFDLSGIPLYDGDVEAQGDPAEVVALKEAVRGADALLLATPEYNGGTSAALKNAIDWASRSPSGYAQSAIYGKTVAIMGSGGGGAVRAQSQLREVLSTIGIEMEGFPEVKVAAVWDKFDEDGRLVDREAWDQIQGLLEALEDRPTQRLALAA